MAPLTPALYKPVKKDVFPTVVKGYKPTLFTESASGRPATSLPVNIRGVSWSPTGALIATCTSAHIRIWNPERPNVKSSTEIRNGHNSSFAGGPASSGAVVEKVGFCPTTENILASTGHDNGVRLWDVRVPGGAAAGKGTQLADCKIGDPGLFLTWHPNGREMLVGTKEDSVYSLDVRKTMNFDDAISQWTLESLDKTPAAAKGSPTRYYGMCFSNSGREVFATTGDGPVKIFDYPTMDLLHTISGHTHATYTVQQSPRGDWLAVGGGDSIITLWDTIDWHCSHALTAHTSAVRDLSFSFDGAYIVAGSGSDARDAEKGLEIYHVDTGDVVHKFDTSHAVTTAAFHPYRYWIAYAGDSGGLKILGVGSNL